MGRRSCSSLYAIYEKRDQQLSLFDEDEDLFDLNEAEQKLRQIKKDDPEEFDRIANLRDGIRSSYPTNTKGIYVFCQSGQYQQLFLTDPDGNIISRDIDKIINTIKCGPAISKGKLPSNYNEVLMKIKLLFANEAKHRQAERDYIPSLTQGQKYILKELRVMFNSTEDDDKRHQIEKLEQVFRGTITSAVSKELNLLRRNSVIGDPLLKDLIRIYNQHNMDKWSSNEIKEQIEIPRIICSEALV